MHADYGKRDWRISLTSCCNAYITIYNIALADYISFYSKKCLYSSWIFPTQKSAQFLHLIHQSPKTALPPSFHCCAPILFRRVPGTDAGGGARQRPAGARPGRHQHPVGPRLRCAKEEGGGWIFMGTKGYITSATISRESIPTLVHSSRGLQEYGG